MRGKPAAGITRCRCGNPTESGSVTRWEMDPTGGPHLAVKRGAGLLCQWPQRRGGRGSLADPVWAGELDRAGVRRGRGKAGHGGEEKIGPS